MVTFSCKDGWNIWWLFLLALGSTQNQGSYFPSLSTSTILPYLCDDGNWTQGFTPSQPFKLFLSEAAHGPPVEADFQYREVSCCLGDLIQFFRLFPLCVVPFVWQDIHECHLPPGPHPAQACRCGRSRWVQETSGSARLGFGEWGPYIRTCP